MSDRSDIEFSIRTGETIKELISNKFTAEWYMGKKAYPDGLKHLMEKSPISYIYSTTDNQYIATLFNRYERRDNGRFELHFENYLGPFPFPSNYEWNQQFNYYYGNVITRDKHHYDEKNPCPDCNNHVEGMYLCDDVYIECWTCGNKP